MSATTFRIIELLRAAPPDSLYCSLLSTISAIIVLCICFLHSSMRSDLELEVSWQAFWRKCIVLATVVVLFSV